MPPNEIHLPFTSDAEGNGSPETTSDMRVPDDDGKSVVVHLASVPHEEAHGDSHAGEHSKEEKQSEQGASEHTEHTGGGAGHTHQPKALCANLG